MDFLNYYFKFLHRKLFYDHIKYFFQLVKQNQILLYVVFDFVSLGEKNSRYDHKTILCVKIKNNNLKNPKIVFF